VLQHLRDAVKTERGSCAVLALGVLAVHLATLGCYGYHRDELYLLACGRHAAWGSVDHAPLTPAISRALALAFGEAPASQRLFAAVSGTIVLWLTGGIARTLGGGRAAQLLAMASIAIAPAFVYTRGVHTTNAVDQLAWTAAAYLIAGLVATPTPGRWIALGVVIGVGLLGKYTMLVFGAGFAVGLVVTARRQLATPWPYVATAIAVAIWLPNLAWQYDHGYPIAQFLRDHHAARVRSVSLAALCYEQPVLLGPLGFVIACAGLREAWRTHRIFAVMFAAVLGVFVASHGKPYYLAPIYPGLVAIGAVACARTIRRWRLVVVAWTIAGAIALVATLPVLPAGLAHDLGLYRTNAELVQFADWRDLASQIAQAARGSQATAVLTDSYGTAAAIDAFGGPLGLPPPISGANSYALWLPSTGPDEVIAIGYSPALLRELYREVSPVGQTRGPFGLDNRFDFPRTIYRCRGKRAELSAPALRRYD
jgi:hypothetical protein